MDAVILAGGKGSRLEGVMPPYWKPLMPVNGVPLVTRLYDQVSPLADKVFVVVAPENALQIAQVMGWARHPYMIVQPTPRGPGHALCTALELSKADTALVVMGDNLIQQADLQAICEATGDSSFVIGTAQVDTPEEASRFTRIYSDGLTIEEGELDLAQHRGRGPFTVWCGPLALPVVQAVKALKYGIDPAIEWKIGDHLRNIDVRPQLVPCSTVDIGTPETIMEVSQ